MSLSPEILVSSEYQSQPRQDARRVEDLRWHGKIDDDLSSHGPTPLLSPTGVDNARCECALLYEMTLRKADTFIQGSWLHRASQVVNMIL